MARGFVTPTTAAPYAQTWDAANNNLNSTDVDEAPVALPEQMTTGADFIVIQPAVNSAAAGAAPEWQLVALDTAIAQVVAVLSVVSGDMPTVRYQDVENDAVGQRLHTPIRFDVRGLSRGGIRWYVAVASLGGATNAYLVSVQGVRGRPI